MPASIRIIKIVKDKIGPMGEEEEAYTAEIECEAENAKDLERELMGCPYGDQIMALLKRAEFIPEGKPDTVEDMKREAAEQEAELKKREDELREEGRKEVREKYVEYLRKKRLGKRATDALEKLAEEENAEADATKEESQTDEDDRAISPSDPRFRGLMPT